LRHDDCGGGNSIGVEAMRDAIDMAREAGLRSAVLLHMYGKEDALCDSEIEELRQIEHLVALVRADEREACAKVCDARTVEYDGFTAEQNASEKLAAAIRARGQA
jgi:hypothetical protein